jgi:hypothetical protein
MLAEHGDQSTYSIAKSFGVSEASIHSSIIRLRELNAICTGMYMRNHLTRFGWRLYESIRTLNDVGEVGVNKEEFKRRFGPDVVEALRRLHVLVEKPYIYIERRLLDPPITENESGLLKGYLVAGVIDPNDNFIPIGVPRPPKYVSSPDYGELKHIGGGVYAPRTMVRESLMEYLPLIIGILGPFVFGALCIVASELSKGNQKCTCL